MENRPLYKHIASAIIALRNCENATPPNEFGLRLHQDALRQFASLLPSGSGIDCGTKIDVERSSEKALRFTFSFHHMNDTGMYDGWTEHELIVSPSLCFDIELRITGKDRNDVKEYLYDTYRHALSAPVSHELIGTGENREVKYSWVSL